MNDVVSRGLTAARYAMGGATETPWYVRGQARQMDNRPPSNLGPLLSPVGGRTDSIPANVPAGGYVIPSDIVSGLGQGNTLNGSKVLDGMFKSGPYGMKMSPPKAGRTMPRAPKPLVARADGGPIAGGDVPIMAAGGEYILSPEEVAGVGGGDVELGHSILDKWVVETRKDHVKALKKLPGPAK